ncbi:NAD(P)/FAD-dependent oxidoreductase [Cesiribacter andamanensis]|uniref:Thioredoxin reductase n=1 Tax=Cesiribacter andamanensis AMV16 TaxID=1279009 RepID=M7NHX9_9BACT|nr:NAD(P)/FAD-dependent oxidoreductase [Cesiribacter andamanensis]EMR01420.1 Thioredoxin reductase [Cesiribacter andamanensis AMV16]
MTAGENLDVIIVGGSYAGLSAAMALGRSLRRVLVIDSGLPCNRHTPHSHNFITQDGEKPAAIAEKARAQVLRYPSVQFLNALAVRGRKTERGFAITTQSGLEVEAKKLIFATGIRDHMPDIQGFADCWGISVVHCPYCHGYELQGLKTGIMANGERAFHLVSLVHTLTDKLTILTAGKADFTPEQRATFSRHRIEIIETEIGALAHRQGAVEKVILNNGNSLAVEALYAALPFTQHSEIPHALGCELTEQGYLKVDAVQKTTLEGVYACGDSSNMMRSVANAVYSGQVAGAMANAALAHEQF